MRITVGDRIHVVIDNATASRRCAIQADRELPSQFAQLIAKNQSQFVASTAASTFGSAPTSLVRLEESLKNTVPEVFERTKQKGPAVSTLSKSAAESDEALQRAADEVVGQLDEIDAEIEKTRQQFAVDREQLRSAARASPKVETDAVFVKRYAAAVAEFEARVAELKHLAQAVKVARAAKGSTQPARTADIKAALQALADFLVKYPSQRTHQAADPNNLPFRFAKAEVRAPIEDSSSMVSYLAKQTLKRDIQAKFNSGPTGAPTSKTNKPS